MSLLKQQNLDPVLAACYKDFVDLLARMREAEIKLNIYESVTVDTELGPCKTTELTLWNFDSNCELPVFAMTRPFPLPRCDEELFIETTDQLGVHACLAALSFVFDQEDTAKNVLDCSIREMLGPNYHVIRYIDEAGYAKEREKRNE